jgi:hypothetical protein
MRTNNLPIEDLEEEKKFRENVEKFNMDVRIEHVKFTRAYKYAAADKARKKYEKKLIAKG